MIDVDYVGSSITMTIYFKMFTTWTIDVEAFDEFI